MRSPIITNWDALKLTLPWVWIASLLLSGCTHSWLILSPGPYAMAHGGHELELTFPRRHHSQCLISFACWPHTAKLRKQKLFPWKKFPISRYQMTTSAQNRAQRKPTPSCCLELFSSHFFSGCWPFSLDIYIGLTGSHILGNRNLKKKNPSSQKKKKGDKNELICRMETTSQTLKTYGYQRGK